MAESVANAPGAGRPYIGMIVPPATAVPPPEAAALYGDDVRFVARGLGVTELTPDSFGLALTRLDSAIDELVRSGVDAVSLMGTSISFYRGNSGHDELLRRMEARARPRPVSTMSLAVVRALTALDARRVVIGSPYSEQVAAALDDFLTAHGFEVLGSRSLGLVEIPAIRALTDDDLVALGDVLFAEHPAADTLVLSCGALRTAGAVERLAARWRRPVVSSSQAGCWDAVRLVDERTAGPVSAWTGLSA